MKLFKKNYYEKLFKKESTVEDYQLIIREAQKSIERLQKECVHSYTEVVIYSWRPGAMYPTKICSSCQKVLVGDITEEEAATAWSKCYGNTEK